MNMDPGEERSAPRRTQPGPAPPPRSPRLRVSLMLRVFYEKACCVKGPTWWPQPTSGRHAPRTTLLFALSEGAQIMGAPVQAGVRSSDAANSDNGLTPQARTRNAVVRTRSLSGRFFVLPPSSFWLGELEPAPLAPPALVIRIVDAPAHPQPVHEHRELSRHRHHRSLLGVLAPARTDPLAVAPQITLRPVRTQNVVRRADQQPPPQLVARLA